MAQQQATMADVQKIKDEFIELHNQVPELISDDALELLLALVRDTKVDPAYLVRRLKENIKDAVLKDFVSMWQMQNFDIHLAVLEEAKKMYAGGDKAWRPTGKTPEEQVRGIAFSVLKPKIAYLEELIKEQCDELTHVLPEVESNRSKMRNLLHQRETTLNQLHSNHEYYKGVFNDADRLKKYLQDKVREISSK